jgi:23S rRNA (pseudouridine1915-N3)-methyltransferase
VAEACAEYLKRMPRNLAVELIELKPAARGGGVPAILADEAKRIVAACGSGTLVALYERGSAWTSAGFARELGRWRDAAIDVAFAIGSADGLDPGLQRRAQVRLQLSALTLPHALARVVLCEQLFRAASLLEGHPYHRA